MGDGPGHAGIVGEVRESGDAGKGKAYCVEGVAGDVVLVVHGRHVQGTMGIARQQGLARGGSGAAHHPVVAAVLQAVPEEGEMGQTGA